MKAACGSSDGAFYEDLWNFGHPVLGHGLGVGALPGLPREGQVAEDVPGLEQAQRGLFTTRVGSEQLQYALRKYVKGVAVFALVVDGVAGSVHPVRGGDAHLAQEPQ